MGTGLYRSGSGSVARLTRIVYLMNNKVRVEYSTTRYLIDRYFTGRHLEVEPEASS